MKANCIWYAAFFCVTLEVEGSTLSIHWFNDRPLTGFSGVLLDAGTAANGDGALLELGYYSGPHSPNPFNGDWTVLAAASLGDDGINRDGYFDVTTVLTAPVTNAPPVGKQLVIRFYDAASVANATYYNVVSHVGGAWNWIEPTEEGAVLELAVTKASIITGLKFGGDDWRTTVPVPEPGPLALGMAAGLYFARWRRRTP